MEQQIKKELIEMLEKLTSKYPNYTIEMNEVKIYKTENLN